MKIDWYGVSQSIFDRVCSSLPIPAELPMCVCLNPFLIGSALPSLIFHNSTQEHKSQSLFDRVCSSLHCTKALRLTAKHGLNPFLIGSALPYNWRLGTESSYSLNPFLIGSALPYGYEYNTVDACGLNPFLIGSALPLKCWIASSPGAMSQSLFDRVCSSLQADSPWLSGLSQSLFDRVCSSLARPRKSSVLCGSEARLATKSSKTYSPGIVSVREPGHGPFRRASIARAGRAHKIVSGRHKLVKLEDQGGSGHNGSMLTRRLFLAAYDVSDPRRLRKALKILKGYSTGGQKSVFECFLTDGEVAELLKEVTAVLDLEEDRFLLTPVETRSPVRVFGVAVAPSDPDYFYVE